MTSRSALRLAAAVFLLSFEGCSGCFQALIPPIPGVDGGIDDLEYNAIVGAPGPILVGGDTRFGGLEFTTSFDGGIRTVTISGVADLTVTYPNAASVIATGDLTGDGIVDYHFNSGLTGTTARSVSTQDLDGDGIDDVKNEKTFETRDGFTLSVVETQSAMTDGGWVVQNTYSGPAAALQAGGGGGTTTCNGYDGFPDLGDNDPVFDVPNTKIKIIANNSSGACTADQAKRLIRIFKNTIRDAAVCLGTANPRLAAQLKLSLSSQELNVACGNTCSGVLASTDLPTGDWAIPETYRFGARAAVHATQRMNLNPDYFSHSDVYIEEIVLHELLHFSGTNHVPFPAGDPVGRDTVYGCGRYCAGVGGCKSCGATTAGENTPESYAWDCATCSDAKRRLACGVKFDLAVTSPSACCSDNECSACNSLKTAYFCDNKTLVPDYKPGTCCNAGSVRCTDATLAASCVPGLAKPGSLFNTCSKFPIAYCQSGGQAP